MAPDTYGQILARNIRAARSRVDIDQGRVAARMQALGFTEWIRQTVGATERGRRRPTAEEMAGLALALETTIRKLISPADEDPPMIALRPKGEPVSSSQVRLLVAGSLTARGTLEFVAVGWDGDNLVQEVMRGPGSGDTVGMGESGEA